MTVATLLTPNPPFTALTSARGAAIEHTKASVEKSGGNDAIAVCGATSTLNRVGVSIAGVRASLLVADNSDTIWDKRAGLHALASFMYKEQ
jgi:hypothetical protein